MANRPLTMRERAVAVLRDPEQKVAHPDVAHALALIVEHGAASIPAWDDLARRIVHVEHEATYSPTE